MLDTCLAVMPIARLSGLISQFISLFVLSMLHPQAMLELDVRRSLDNASPGDSLLLPSEPSDVDPLSRAGSLHNSRHGSRAELHRVPSHEWRGGSPHGAKAASHGVEGGLQTPSGLSRVPLASLNAAAEASERDAPGEMAGSAAETASGMGVAGTTGAPTVPGPNVSLLGGVAQSEGGTRSCSIMGESAVSGSGGSSPGLHSAVPPHASTPMTPGPNAATLGAPSGTSPRLGPRLLELLPPTGNEASELYIKVLAARLVVVRLQLNMLAASTNALVKRLLFPSRSEAKPSTLTLSSLAHSRSDPWHSPLAILAHSHCICLPRGSIVANRVSSSGQSACRPAWLWQENALLFLVLHTH